MKCTLLRSNSFINAAKKLVKKDPSLAAELETACELLSENIYDTNLRSHKLKGKLHGSMACSVNYSVRVVFKIVKYQGNDAILLETIGTHDEIY